jgi:hypothetical protein
MWQQPAGSAEQPLSGVALVGTLVTLLVEALFCADYGCKNTLLS